MTDLKQLNNWFHEHAKEDKDNFLLINNKLDEIKDNHLAHIQTDLNKTTTDVSWLMRYHWIIATASIGALVAGIVSIMK